MSPDQRRFLDTYYPDHHLKSDDIKQLWKVYAYGTFHLFTKGKYFSMERAKAAAIAFRDSLPSAGLTWDDKDMSSGTAGVIRTTRKGIPYWKATWYEPERLRTNPHKRIAQRAKSFSISKYGENEARHLAIQYRLSKLFELEKLKV